MIAYPLQMMFLKHLYFLYSISNKTNLKANSEYILCWISLNQLKIDPTERICPKSFVAHLYRAMCQRIFSFRFFFLELVAIYALCVTFMHQDMINSQINPTGSIYRTFNSWINTWWSMALGLGYAGAKHIYFTSDNSQTETTLEVILWKVLRNTD